MNPVIHSRPQHEVVRDIRNFLVSADALPSPQGTALRIVEMARDPDSSLEDIVSVVKTDPARAARCLGRPLPRHARHGQRADRRAAPWPECRP
jgi:hypothetical protein